MTKKLLIIAACAIMALPLANAQEEGKKESGSWTTTSTPALKIGEFFFNNWSKSGNSQIDATGTFFGNYKYSHPKYVWDNIVDLAYGYAWQDLAEGDTLFETHRKSNDKIDISSAISWKAYKDWGASFTANLKTQFGYGYEYSGIGADQKKKTVSSFFAPAYLTTALSFEYKRENWFVSLSFLTGKTTFVFNDALIDSGYTYGVIQDKDFRLSDGTLNPNRNYTHSYFALGSYVRAQYLKKDILPSLDLYTRLELFYDYKKPKNMAWGDNMENESSYSLVEDETWATLKDKNWLQKRFFETDVDFEFKLDYRFLSFLSANFAVNLRWDTDFNGMGKWGHWQIYQMAGVQFYFNWKTPKAN